MHTSAQSTYSGSTGRLRKLVEKNGKLSTLGCLWNLFCGSEQHVEVLVVQRNPLRKMKERKWDKVCEDGKKEKETRKKEAKAKIGMCIFRHSRHHSYRAHRQKLNFTRTLDKEKMTQVKWVTSNWLIGTERMPVTFSHFTPDGKSSKNWLPPIMFKK